MSENVRLNLLRVALEEIAKGEGPYKCDPLEFAESVIENLTRIATKALDADRPEGQP